MGDKLELQIKDGLTKLDFANMIKTSLVTKDPVDRETSFKIGNRLKVRFVIYFEPAYGKERGKKNEESTNARSISWLAPETCLRLINILRTLLLGSVR